MEISNILKELLAQEDIQIAINNSNFEYVYDYINSKEMPMDIAKEFTRLFTLASLDPIKHMSKIPSGFFSEATMDTYEIPDNIKKIEEYAFIACENLKLLYIPKSVEKIENSSFFLCSNLKDIYFDGSAQLFNTVSIAHKIFGLIKEKIPVGTKIHCSNMDIFLN